jgi:hypothetical protein
MMHNIALIIVPVQEVERPPMGPAVLKSIAQSMGHKATVYDLNVWLYEKVNADQFWRYDMWFKTDAVAEQDPTTRNEIAELFKEFIETNVLLQGPTMIGISVFSNYSTRSSVLFLEVLKSIGYTGMRVAGGSGLTTPYETESGLNDSGIQNVKTSTFFSEHLKKKDLIDHYITGDAEDSWQEFLNGNYEWPGIDNHDHIQIRNLDDYPWPDYSDTPPSIYYPTSGMGVYVNTSRGCFRKCTFCDVPWRWPKFSYRKGELVADEMFHMYKQYGVKIYQLADSTMNGSQKQWDAMNQRLLEHRKEDPNFKDLTILGMGVIRRAKEMPESSWQLMGEVGRFTFICGIESYSERVRDHMRKEMTNDDIDFHLRMSARYGHSNLILMFVGYPTETLEDHQMNIEFLHKYRKYMQSGTIWMVRWGFTGSLDIGSPLANATTDLKIVQQDPDLNLSHLVDSDRNWIYGRNWLNLGNPDLTLEERMRRRIEIHEIACDLGYIQPKIKEELVIIRKILTEFKGKGNKQKQMIPIIAYQEADH